MGERAQAKTPMWNVEHEKNVNAVYQLREANNTTQYEKLVDSEARKQLFIYSIA